MNATARVIAGRPDEAVSAAVPTYLVSCGPSYRIYVDADTPDAAMAEAIGDVPITITRLGEFVSARCGRDTWWGLTQNYLERAGLWLQEEKDMAGAVDLDECPQHGKKRYCRCGTCRKCGFPKHSAIHGPLFGQPPGSKPYGHAYVEEKAAP